ncbi:MAG: SPFH domain-containing protein [Nitrososphaeraceae archaeon]
MRNPFKRSGKSYDRRTPEGEPLEYTGSRSIMGLNKLKILAAIITFIVIIVILSESVVIVQAGHRGVVLYVGAVENKVLGEGLHFIIPFAEQVIQLEVRTLKFQADASAASNDLQEVATTIVLNYHIDPTRLKQLQIVEYAIDKPFVVNLC